MPQDVLTDRLRTYFEQQGIAASDTDLSKIIDERRKELVAIDPTYRRKASMADALGTGLWHAFESSTLGIPGLLTESKLEKKYGRPWAEKDTNERIAAAIGEVAGLVNPIGAFGLMSKGLGKGIGYVTGKGTSRIFAKSADDAVDLTLQKLGSEGLAKIGVKKGLSSAQGATVKQTIKNTFKDKLMKQKSASIAAKGRAGKETLDSISNHVNPAISQALTDAGVTSGRAALTRQIGNQFQKGIANGEHINSISRLVASSMGAVNQTAFRQGLNKYVGMAVQDMVLLTSYNSLAGAVESAKSGEEMDWGSTLKHSLYLSLTFPALRKIAGGGQRTLREGGRFIRGWNAVNYKKMDKDALNKYLGVMYGGEKAGSNLLKGQTFILKSGKPVEWGEGSFRKQISDLSHSDKVDLAEQIRAFGSKGFGKWGKSWLADMGKSVPRMAMGAAANNVDMFKDGMWARIPPEELLTHLLIGAYFTRSRGEWNHGRPDKTNLNDYYELFHITGLKPTLKDGTDLTKWLFWNEVDGLKKMQGGNMATNATLAPFMDIISKEAGKVKYDQEGNPVNEKGEKLTYEPIDRVSEPHIRSLIDYYNMIEYMRTGLDSKHVPFQIEHLTPEIRAKLNTRLGNQEVMLPDGTKQKYHEFGKGKLDTQLEMELGFQVTGQLKDFLFSVKDRLKNELGIDYPIADNSIDDGKVTRLQLPRKGEVTPEDESLTLRYFLGLRKRINNQYRIGQEATEEQEFIWPKDKEKDVDRIISEEKAKIEEKYSKELFGEYSEGESFDLFSDNILGQIVTGNTARIENSWLKILSGKDVDSLSKHEKDVVKIISTIFGDPTSEIPTWEIIEASIVDGKKAVDPQNQKYAGDIKILRQLYDLVAIGKTPTNTGQARKSQPKVDLSKLKELNDAVDLGNLEASTEMAPLNIGVRQRYFDHEFGRHHDGSKVFVLSQIQNMGLGIRVGNKVQVMSHRGLKDILRDKHQGIDLTEKELNELAKHYQEATEGYLGNLSGTVEYVDKIPGEHEISVEGIRRMHRMIPEVWWNETSAHVRKVSNEIKQKIVDENFDTVLQEIEIALRDFATFGNDAEGVTDRVEKSITSLHDILNVKYKGENPDIIKNARKLVDSLRSDIEAAIKERGEGGGSVNLNEVLGTEAASVLREAIFEIQKPNYQMVDILNEIYNAGAHIGTRPEAWMYYNHLRQQIMGNLGKGKMTTELNLDEMIKKFNGSNKGIADWLKITQASTDFIAQNAIVRDKSATLISRTEAYLKLQETHHKQSMAEIADHYFIQPVWEFGQRPKSPIDTVLLDSIVKLKPGADTNDLHTQKIIEFVKQRIDGATELSDGDKKQRMKDFMNFGLYHIVNGQLGQGRRQVVKFKNGFWYESTQTVRLTQRHQFIEKMKRQGIELGEILTTAIDGNEVNLYSLMKDPKKLIQMMNASFQKESDLVKVRERGDIAEDDILPVHKAAREGGIIPMVASAANAFYIPKTQLGEFHNVFTKFYADNLTKLDTLINDNSLSLEVRSNLRIARDNFESAFDVLAKESTSQDNVEMKFVALYMNEMNPVKFMQLFGAGVKDAKAGIHMDDNFVSAWNDKMIKYSKTFEAQNQSPVTRVALELMANNHPNEILAAHAAKKMTSTKILGVADEFKGSAFDARKSIIRDLEYELEFLEKGLSLGEVSEETEPLKAAIEAMKNEIEGKNGFHYDSLGETKRNPETVSTKNAAVYISAAEAMVYSALTNQTFDPMRTQVINGWKPKISYTSADGMESVQQKTWYIYSPRLEGKMTELGVDQIAFGSALKTFGSLRGDKSKAEIQFSDRHLNEETSWETELTSDSAHIIDITNPESISIGFTNHRGTAVSAGNTVTNLMPRDVLSRTRIWQGLEDIVTKGIGLGRQMNLDARNEIAEVLYKWQKQDSGGWLSDDASLIQNLLEMGANSSNVAISDGINRLWTSKVLGMIRRPQLTTGLSSYLAHDEIFDTTKPRKIYDVKVDMYENPSVLDRTGEAQDVWVVDNLGEARAQLKAIKAGRGGGTLFSKNITKTKEKGHYVLKHRRGDDKHIYIKGTEPEGLVPDTKGRTKGQPYEISQHGTGNRIRLKMPIYTEAGKGTRRQLRLGDVYAPSDWGGKHISDVNQLRFVTTINGVDVVVGYDNKKLYKEKGEDRWVAIDPTEGAIALENAPKGYDPKSESYANAVLKAKAIVDGIHSKLNDPHDNMFKIQDIIAHLEGKNLDVVTNTLAIPRKSADMVVNRVRGVLDAEYGNNWMVNDYELAITHQRDFDADHFFTYNDLPMQAIKNNIFQTAQIRDYPQMDRHKPDVNPFGFSADKTTGTGRADEGNVKTIASYMADIETRRRTIGTLIGLNQPLTWMNNLDLSMKIDGVTSPDFSKFEFVMTQDNIDRTVGMHHRIGTTGQNTVDFFGGKSSMLADIDMRSLLFGDGQNTGQIPFQHKSIQHQHQAMKLSENNSEIQVAVLTAIARRLQKASLIFNDTFEGGKRRNITIKDIQKTHSDIQNFFNNPNKVVFLDLMNQTKDPVKHREIIRFFYGDNPKLGITEATTEAEAISKLLDNIKNFRGIPEPENIINIGVGKKEETRSQDRWESSNSGFSVRRLFEGSDAFRSPEMVEGFHKNVLEPKDDFTPEDMANNIYESTVLLRAFGLDPKEGMEHVKQIVRNDENEILKDNMMDATLHILNSKLMTIRGQKAFLEGAKYPNQEELSRAKQEMATVEMAIENVKASILTNIQEYPDSQGKKGFKVRLNGGMVTKKNTKWNSVFVYALPKNLGELNPRKLAKEGVLDFVTTVNKGKTFDLPSGRDYVIMLKPIQRIPLSRLDAVQGISWLNATRHVSPDNIAIQTGKQGLDFAQDMQRVKSNILRNFGKAMDSMQDSPAEAGRVWETERAFAYHEIGKLIDAYTEGGGSSDSKETINDIALMLLMPDPVVKATMDIKNMNIPFFRVNKRMHKHVLGWLNENGYLKGSRVESALKYASDYENYILGHFETPDAVSLRDGLEGGVSSWDKHRQEFGEMWSTVMNLSKGPFSPLVTWAYQRKGLKTPYKYTKGTIWGDRGRADGYLFWSRANNMNKYLRTELNELNYDGVTGANCK